jgi:Domain of unknown function (DUF3471)
MSGLWQASRLMQTDACASKYLSMRSGATEVEITDKIFTFPHFHPFPFIKDHIMKTTKAIIAIFVFVAAFGALQAQNKGKKAKAEGKTEVKEAKMDSTAILQEFVGTYNVKGSNDFSQAFITLENGQLFGRADAQPQAAPLVASATPDKFTISTPESAAEITFFRDDSKQVTSIKIYYNGLEVRGEKAK